MREYGLYIDGTFSPAASGQTFDSVNPFNQSVVATLARAGSADADRAVRAARSAFDNGPWTKMSKEERSALLKAVADKITEKKALFETLEVEDSGGTIKKVKEDVYLSARAMSLFSKMALTDPLEQLDGVSRPGFSQNYLLREPVGVVAAVTPWNFPLKMAVWKLGPALAAGNTVVLKPSELAPCSAMELAQIFHDAGFPKGVVNIIPGFGEEAGAPLAAHPMVDKVTFTGSTAVGRKIMAAAAATLKKCTLECGGKSANIVLGDADLSIALDGALYAIFYHQGQCCEAGTRLFLPTAMHDDFVAKMVDKARRMKLGDPTDPATDIGPVISAKQRDTILRYIESGMKQGAMLATGGSAPKDPALAKGNFVEPTIFTGVRNDMTIAQEEIFGPVLSVIPYTDADDAVRQANASIYGLAAGVWSRDKEKAAAVARRLRAGTVWINEWHLMNEKAPFGGYKQSGVGREFGLEGLHEYSEAKHVHVDEAGLREKRPWYDTVIPKS